MTKVEENANNVTSLSDQQNTKIKADLNKQSGLYFVRKKCIEMLIKSKESLYEHRIYQQIKYMVNHHPLSLFGFIIATTIFLVPIALFFVFLIINVALVFTTFIIIEGTLLMIGASVIGCVTFFMISFFIVGGIFLFLFFYLLHFSLILVREKLHSK